MIYDYDCFQWADNLNVTSAACGDCVTFLGLSKLFILNYTTFIMSANEDWKILGWQSWGKVDSQVVKVCCLSNFQIQVFCKIINSYRMYLFKIKICRKMYFISFRNTNCNIETNTLIFDRKCNLSHQNKCDKIQKEM